MSSAPQKKALILLVTVFMVATAFAQLGPVPVEDEASEPWGPVGEGEGMEPIAITPDPTEDRFRALLPWPTNRTIYGIHYAGKFCKQIVTG